MAQSVVHIRKLPDAGLAAAWAGQHTLTIDRSERAGGTGRGFSPGELLRLAVGACVYISLSREAAQRAIALTRVEIDVHAEWGGDPERVRQITCTLMVEADASEADILDLIRCADQGAEVLGSLRMGFAVTIADVRAAPGATQPAAAAGPAPRADAVLEMLGTTDAPGATCAGLTPAIKARLRELAGGQVLEVRVDDPGAREDIAAWCRLAGHALLAVVDDTPGYTRYFLSKKLG